MAAVVLLAVWHVVPVQEERVWTPGASTGLIPPDLADSCWESNAGWSAWPDLWESVRDAPSASMSDPETWQMLVFTSCFLSGTLGVLMIAVIVWFGVPRMLRVAVAVAMTLALAGGPVLIVFLWYSDPPDPDFYRFLPVFWLWPAAVTMGWLASLVWAAGRGNRGPGESVRSVREAGRPAGGE